jgi:hypothetical protein
MEMFWRKLPPKRERRGFVARMVLDACKRTRLEWKRSHVRVKRERTN